MSDISADPEFQALRALSAGVERNRLRTQAAGGNTSIKRDGVMWIKASGRQLADALDDDIMVPVALEDLRRRPITTEAIGSAATHPSLRGALATKQSRGHGVRGASSPADVLRPWIASLRSQ